MKQDASGSQAGRAGIARRNEALGVVGKYWLFQTPGIAMAALVLYALYATEVLAPRWAVALFGLWLVKEAVLFPFLRIAYEPHRKGGVHDLVGATGVSEEDLAPAGYVRIGAELWRAEIRGSGEPIPVGRRVRVRAVLGLTLICEPDDEGEGRSGAPEGSAPTVTEGT
jgi:membrane protein implicated in regulation of membrane protease activity